MIPKSVTHQLSVTSISNTSKKKILGKGSELRYEIDVKKRCICQVMGGKGKTQVIAPVAEKAD